jgi:dienelactone hydrolase
MKTITLIIIYFNVCFCAIGQKYIDSSTYNNWEKIDDSYISKNGKYCSFKIQYEGSGKRRLVIKQIDSVWEMTIDNSLNSFITSDSKYFIFINNNDSLGIVNLDNKVVQFVPDVSSCESFKINNKQSLFYTSKSKPDFVIVNLEAKDSYKYINVKRYLYCESSMSLVIEKYLTNNLESELIYINIKNRIEYVFWKGNNLVNVTLNDSGDKVAFMYKDGNDNSIYCFNTKDLSVSEIQNDSLLRKNDRLNFNSLLGFTADSKALYINLKNETQSKLDTLTYKYVDIWNYLNPGFKNSKSSTEGNLRTYKALIDISSKLVSRIEQPNEIIYTAAGNSILLINSESKAYLDATNKSGQFGRKYYLFKISSGVRKRIDFAKAVSYHLSPTGKYLIYFDWKNNRFFSYNIYKGISKCISNGTITKWKDLFDDHLTSKFSQGKIEGWLMGDSALFISDHFDIWKLDPDGKQLPVNITNGYGRKNNITFSTALMGNSQLKLNNILLLKAFNHSTKENGFYQTKIDKVRNPEYLFMGPYIFNKFPLDLKIEKNAVAENSFIVYRESEKNARNLFITKDFKAFKQISNINPQEKYSWLTSELLTWKSGNNATLQGVIYKPKKFDSNKKYPVIIYYYERQSDQLHQFLDPDFCRGPIDIPTFVSRGYIVFLPDIYYKISNPGKSAYTSVVSGAKYLTKFHWVDKKRIGIQGHSFGGYETNYIVSHSNIFAAAMSACGMSNLISHYNYNIDFPLYYTMGQGRMGSNPWNDTKGYIKNSPLFFARNVTTPLLIMANEVDFCVPYSQGFEFFIALSSMGKKCWLLQYPNEGHVITDNDVANDYTNKILSFFDFYLMKKPQPEWMKY